MSLSNPKDIKHRKQILRQGTGARRMGEQGNCSGSGTKGKKMRQKNRCGNPGRTNSRCVNGEALGYEIDEKSIGSKETKEGERPVRFGDQVKSRAQRRGKL